jgi:hypothetical protein
MLTTNSPVSSALMQESLRPPPRLAAGGKHHEGWIVADVIELAIGREIDAAVQAKLEIHPIGRGTSSAFIGE